jgi:hypothetical protein
MAVREFGLELVEARSEPERLLSMTGGKPVRSTAGLPNDRA